MAIAFNVGSFYSAAGATAVFYCIAKDTNAPQLVTMTGDETGEVNTLNADDSTGLDEFVASTNDAPEPNMKTGRILVGPNPTHTIQAPSPTRDGQTYVILQPLADAGTAGVTTGLLCRLLNDPQKPPVFLKVASGGTATPSIAY